MEKDKSKQQKHARGAARVPANRYMDETPSNSGPQKAKFLSGTLRFLTEASKVLASSLDYKSTLEHVTGLAVPALADWCWVDIVGENGKVSRLSIAHANPAKAHLALEFQLSFVPKPGSRAGVPKVLTTGKPVLITEPTEELLASVARDTRHLEIIRELEAKSAMFVPMVSRERVLGVITFVTAESGRIYTEDDLALAEELAHHAALAIENARLYQEAQNLIRRKEESLAVLDTLLETAPVGFAFVDRNLRYVRVNECLARLDGVPIERFAGQAIRDVLPELGTKVEPLYRSVIETGKPVIGIEVSGETPGFPGQNRHWIANYYPVWNSGGDIIGVGAVLVEITDRKKAEEERLELERKILETQKLESLGALAGGVAHDFNNLLMTVLGNAEMALNDLEPGSDVYQAVEQISVSARRATGIARQMLHFSGRGRYAEERLNLNGLVEGMLDLLLVPTGKNATFIPRLSRPLPEIMGDPAQIRQVVLNLVTNAAESLRGEQGTITLNTGYFEADANYLASTKIGSALPGGTYVYLEVTDTGNGMDPETLAKIFDPFFTTKFTGRGLGLPAVLGIVRAHKGTLKVDSVPGAGTTIRVLFPCLDSATEASQPRKLLKTRSGNGDGKLLVVDDEEGVRRVIALASKKSGFEVLAAQDGEEALQIFSERRHEISCVLVDMTMPRMSGLEVIDALKEISPETPAILMSGYNEQEVTEQFAGRKLDGFVQKPFSLKVLLETVQRVISESTPFAYSSDPVQEKGEAGDNAFWGATSAGG